MQQTGKPVLVRHIPHDLHRDHVVIDRQVELLEHRGQLELGRGDLVMTRAGRHAQAPQLGIQIAHELHDAALDGAEVVIIHLLMLGRLTTEERAPGLNQIGAIEIEILVDQEILLLRAECGVGATPLLDTEELAQTADLRGECRH